MGKSKDKKKKGKGMEKTLAKTEKKLEKNLKKELQEIGEVIILFTLYISKLSGNIFVIEINSSNSKSLSRPFSLSFRI